MFLLKMFKCETVLGVTLGNVQVYYTTNKHSKDNYWNYTYTGTKYQCVELARRYLIINRSITFCSVPNAHNIFDLEHFYTIPNYKPTRIQKQLNGSHTAPQIGDLIIWKPHGIFKNTGHVAIVVDIRESYIDIVEQNVENKKWPRGQNYSRRIPTYRVPNGGFWICDCYKDTEFLGWINIPYLK